MSDPNGSPTPPPPAEAPVLHVERLYLKDLSFESPRAPGVFQEPGEPKVELSLNTASERRGEEHFEVTIRIEAKVTNGSEVYFLVDVTYAGLFLLRNIPQPHLGMALGIECPHILFPYVRQIISQVVQDGGFKPMVLDPINFAAMFHQAQSQRQAEVAAASAEAERHVKQ
ncbi:MAG: protein-export chaperone SecB [Magnetococcales bacterium]|nr:protein-export chaperone SecB [Magnetococcales bacterium]MBF0156772.1 protein-export chaperone SecB [Magnetococcales bacterium]